MFLSLGVFAHGHKGLKRKEKKSVGSCGYDSQKTVYITIIIEKFYSRLGGTLDNGLKE